MENTNNTNNIYNTNNINNTNNTNNEENSNTIKYRLEHDSIGEKRVPADAYYGIQTLRASENFYITGLTMHPELINSVAQIKKAALILRSES